MIASTPKFSVLLASPFNLNKMEVHMSSNVGGNVGHVGFNQFLNGAGEAGEWLLENGTKVIVPALLGGIGGKIVSVGIGKGMVQGTVAGALYSYALSPLGSYISKQPTEGEAKISMPARGFWYTAGVVANFAVPVFATYYAGDAIIAGATSVLPSFVGNWIQPTSTEYTIIRGVILNFAPAVTQWVIKGLRHEDPRKDGVKFH